MNIQSIDKLLMFTEKGYEVPLNKTYTIEWEIIPNPQIEHLFISNVKGHFIINPENTTNIIPNIVIDNGGKIAVDSSTTIFFNDIEKTKIELNGGAYNEEEEQFILNDATIKEIILLDRYIEGGYNKPRVRRVVNGVIVEEPNQEEERICNTVRLTFNALDESYVMDYPVSVVFNVANINKIKNKVKDGDTEREKTAYATTTELFLAPAPDGYSYLNIIDALIDANFDEESKRSLIPGVRYQGCVWQDKVSTDFVAANTIIFLEQDGETFIRPSFGESSEYKLMFKFQNDSEMRFISSNTVADIIWDDMQVIENNDAENADPVYFSVGFISDLEGCYQNIMAMYIRREYEGEVVIDPETGETETRILFEDYLLGLITFFTEVEGEDERYRALLGNMGIPDPEQYPNIFKQQDPDEEGVDWTLINEKSKELMLTYDNIFPYAGTYKALLGAVKFLGYYDLIFKEWYKIKDKTGRDKFITLQAYDLQKGESLQTKLKRVNVSFGEFEKYKKLNRLTMIYHLNQIEEDGYESIPYYSIDNPNQNWKRKLDPSGETKRYSWFMCADNEGQFYKIPTLYPIYQYRTDEILAKLWSVKEWLEKYILGANCYISDICGEGIILERLKTQSYVTEHYIQDFTSEGKFTPKILLDTSRMFIDSSTVLKCTINEFDNISLEDYEGWNIEKFIKEEITNGSETIYISPPFETLVPANEYQFKLQASNIQSGTLAEFTDKEYIKNPLLIRDNRILFFDNQGIESKIQSDELPLIEIKKANIRYCHGNWKTNICFTVNTVTDQYTGKEFYVFKTRGSEVEDYRGLQKVFLAPIPTETPNTQIFGAAINLNNNDYQGLSSELIYTANNKWNIPMFIIRNYLIRNTNQMLKGDYILEILEGRMIFRNKNKEINNGKAIGADLKFGYFYDLERGEQEIDVDYTYLSEKTPIYYFDKTGFNNDSTADKWTNQEIIDSYVVTNKVVDVSVNRLADYTVQVNAFDSYNNIFVNNSDDITTVTANPVPLDIILNQEFVWNDNDFYEKSGYGEILSESEKQKLLRADIPYKSGYPMYPQNWRIYDIDPVLDSSDQIRYDSISYVMDIPENGDFILFNNFTEHIVKIEKTGTNYKISLYDENPNPETIINSSYIGLCIYDDLQKSIMSDIYPLEVIDISIVEPDLETEDYMDYTYNKSYVTVRYNEDDEESQETLDKLVDQHVLENNRNINGYVYSANELILDVSDISVNYKENFTWVKDFSQHFVENQVIKICYSSEKEIHNHYTKNAIDNENVLRVVDISVLDGSIAYKLDGLIDLFKLNNKLYHNKSEHIIEETTDIAPLFTSYPYVIKMCPAHLKAAQYTLRVSETGQESISYYNGGEVNEMTVRYEYKPLLFNNYLDTTYSATVYSYDPYMLNQIYTDVSILYTPDDDLYRYRDFPVTIKKGRTAVLSPVYDCSTLTKIFPAKNQDVSIPWRIDWDWKSYVIDDLENCPNLNLDLVNKQSIFKSCNPILPVTPELLGTQSPSMTVTDIYGNALTNYADGFMFVDQNEDEVLNRGEEETRDIYYKDVYIIGFDAMVGMRYTMASGGETIVITNSGTGSDRQEQQLEISYRIYYNDGTVLENEGADVQLLSKSGKKARGNKVKVTVSEAEHPHKSVVDSVEGMFILKETNERDLIDPQQMFSVDVQQYGYSKTIAIYNFKFEVDDLPEDGIEEIKEYIIRDLVKNVSYTQTRSEGEIENITADSLPEANLIIKSFRLLSNKEGQVSSVQPNYNGRKLYGQLMLVVEFYVNGVTDIIRAAGVADIYQK